MSSFREATAYATPGAYSGSASASPIAKGTFINSTHFSYTFLCSDCIVGNLTTFAATDATYNLGYAVSGTNPIDPTNAATDLSYHSQAYGEYAMMLSNSSSPNYGTWAAMASASTTPANPSTGSSGSSSTSPVASASSSTFPTGSGSSGTGSSNGTTNATPISNTTYDVIVVGGGPSGIVTAERLAEGGAKVLLLERGGAPIVSLGATDALSWNSTLTPYDLPALGSSLTSMPDISEFCTDTASTAGCILGGSSTINAMNFIHPLERDFDDKWPSGWKWADVSDAASRLYQRNPGTTMPSVDGQHYDQAAFNIVSQILSSKGWQQVDSIESPNSKTKAFSQPAWSILDNKRAGPVRTYLPVAQGLDNFTLKLNTKVTNVVRSRGRVTGVLTTTGDGTSQIINLNDGGKVVLAAGAMSTPRILFNSGIGPADQLQVVQSGSSGVVLPDETDWINIPVGHNVKDHPQYVLQFNSKTNFTAYNYAAIPSGPPVTDQDLYNAGSGVLTQAVQRLHMWTSDSTADDGVTRYLQGTVSALTNGVVTIKAFLTHGATSTGVLGISPSGSTVVQTAPWVNTPGDRQVIGNFLQWLLDTTSGANSTLTFAGASKNASSLIDSRITGDHWTGTAKMGEDDGRQADGTSVVDLDTKVYGTDNLFVVDASMHPDLPTGNTQAIIMVAAEAAAAKIAAYQISSSNTTTTSPSAPFNNSTAKIPVVSSSLAAATKTPKKSYGSGALPTVSGPKPTGVLPTGSFPTAASSSTLATVIAPTASGNVPASPSEPSGSESGQGGDANATMQQIIDLIMQLIETLFGSKST